METKTNVLEITFKKFVYNEALSEETNCFSSDICINGVCVGYAKNSGHGGDTEFIPSGKGKELLQEFIDQQPINFFEIDKMVYAIDSMVMDEVVNFVYKKHYSKNLVFFNSDSGIVTRFPLVKPLKEYLTNATDQSKIRSLILINQSKYGKCINRNLGEIKSEK